MFLNLAQYFSMDRRTIAPILSNFRHFSMLLQFILKRGCLVNTFFVLIALKATLQHHDRSETSASRSTRM
jgi:hypothetical protein